MSSEKADFSKHLGKRLFAGDGPKLMSEDGVLIIECGREAEVTALRSHLLRIADFGIKADFPETAIRLNGRELRRYRTALPLEIRVQSQIIKTVGEIDIFQRFQLAAEQGRAIALVRMRDHKGLLSTNIAAHSGTQDNDWSGQDMAQFWPDDQLQQLLTALETHTKLNEYQYWALRMSDRAPVNICVNAELVMFRGDLCRLITPIHSEPR